MGLDARSVKKVLGRDVSPGFPWIGLLKTEYHSVTTNPVNEVQYQSQSIPPNSAGVAYVGINFSHHVFIKIAKNQHVMSNVRRLLLGCIKTIF